MDRDAQIQRYKERIRRYEKEKQLYKDMICTWKAEAQKWKLYHSRMEEALTMRGQAIHTFTAGREARLMWLYRLGGLHERISEEVRLEVGDIIDAAYEQWRKSCDEKQLSGESTDAESDGSN